MSATTMYLYFRQPNPERVPVAITIALYVFLLFLEHVHEEVMSDVRGVTKVTNYKPGSVYLAFLAPHPHGDGVVDGHRHAGDPGHALVRGGAGQ